MTLPRYFELSSQGELLDCDAVRWIAILKSMRRPRFKAIWESGFAVSTVYQGAGRSSPVIFQNQPISTRTGQDELSLNCVAGQHAVQAWWIQRLFWIHAVVPSGGSLAIVDEAQ